MVAKSSGKVTNSDVVFAGPCWYLGISTSATYVVWDSPTSVVTGDTEVDYAAVAGSYSPGPIWCAKGIYVVITGDFVAWYAL